MLRREAFPGKVATFPGEPHQLQASLGKPPGSYLPPGKVSSFPEEAPSPGKFLKGFRRE
eukprot:gene539-813_t